jgi:acyl-coenzyme A thioesterase PaaI-like protein
MLRSLVARLGPEAEANLYLRAFALTKVPLIAWTGARVVAVDDERCVVRVRLRRRTRNHLRSMYFGVLMVGADVAGGLLAFRRVAAVGRRVSFVFKDVQASFHKRAEGDTYFTCADGAAIAAAIDQTLATGERVSLPVTVTATVPDRLGDEPAATFVLTLSVWATDRAEGKSRPPPL